MTFELNVLNHLPNILLDLEILEDFNIFSLAM